MIFLKGFFFLRRMPSEQKHHMVSGHQHMRTGGWVGGRVNGRNDESLDLQIHALHTRPRKACFRSHVRLMWSEEDSGRRGVRRHHTGQPSPLPPETKHLIHHLDTQLVRGKRKGSKTESGQRNQSERQPAIHPPIPSLTHPPTHPRAHLIARPLSQSVTNSLTHSLIHSLTHSIARSLGHSLTHSLNNSLTR